MAAQVVQVKAVYAVIRDESGSQHEFYKGAILPSGLDGDHVKMLLDEGILELVDAPAEDGEDAVEAKPAKKAAAKRSSASE